MNEISGWCVKYNKSDLSYVYAIRIYTNTHTPREGEKERAGDEIFRHKTHFISCAHTYVCLCALALDLILGLSIFVAIQIIINLMSHHIYLA